MRLWSIQAEEVLSELLAKGRLHGPEVVDADYERAYRWMGQQMVRRSVSSSFCYPLWGWCSFGDRRSRKPDLRIKWHLPPGTRGVRLEFELPAERVLLSQFEMWTWILGGHYIPLTRRELATVEHATTKVSRSKRLKSWERVFDLACGSSALWGPSESRRIQACMSHIRKDDLVDARFFIAK
jgi:Domain of unknown function (DUF3841)